jgi:hypothetical protein
MVIATPRHGEAVAQRGGGEESNFGTPNAFDNSAEATGR